MYWLFLLYESIWLREWTGSSMSSPGISEIRPIWSKPFPFLRPNKHYPTIVYRPTVIQPLLQLANPFYSYLALPTVIQPLLKLSNLCYGYPTIPTVIQPFLQLSNPSYSYPTLPTVI